MKGTFADHELGRIGYHRAGVTLMECVFVLSMVAFSLPVLMLVLGQSRSEVNQMVIHGRARDAILQRADELRRGDFSDGENRLHWAHGNAGECLGMVDEADYRRGLRIHDGKAARFLVVASLKDGAAPNSHMLLLALEYPAAASVERRHRTEFQTRLAP